MLAGIVAMQVEMLKLGASMGRSLQRTTTLQSRNEQLRETVASLADDHRIERLAAGMGMVMPAPDGVGFLPASSGANVQQALSNIHAPNAGGFLSLLTANGTVTGSATGGGSSSGGVGQTSQGNSGGAAGPGTAATSSTTAISSGLVGGGTTSSSTATAGGVYPGRTTSAAGTTGTAVSAGGASVGGVAAPTAGSGTSGGAAAATGGR